MTMNLSLYLFTTSANFFSQFFNIISIKISLSDVEIFIETMFYVFIFVKTTFIWFECYQKGDCRTKRDQDCRIHVTEHPSLGIWWPFEQVWTFEVEGCYTGESFGLTRRFYLIYNIKLQTLPIIICVRNYYNLIINLYFKIRIIG